MFDFLMSDAMAQAATAGAKQNPVMQFVPLIMIGVIFYFLILRPQKKRMDQEQNFNKGLTKGDEVYTKSGIIGKITGLTDKVVTLEVSEGVKVKFVRAQVQGKADALFAKAETKATPIKAK